MSDDGEQGLDLGAVFTVCGLLFDYPCMTSIKVIGASTTFYSPTYDRCL